MGAAPSLRVARLGVGLGAASFVNTTTARAYAWLVHALHCRRIMTPVTTRHYCRNITSFVSTAMPSI